MLKKIKAYFAKKKQRKSQKKEIDRQKKYGALLENGALFIKYIQNDIKKGTLNRSQKRRFDKTMKDGLITDEVVNHYYKQVDKVLTLIENQKEIAKLARANAVKPKT